MKEYYKVTEQGRLYCTTKARTAKGLAKAFGEAMGDVVEFVNPETINGVTYQGEYLVEELPIEVYVQVLILDGMIEKL